jgi:hypothetical protein
MKRNAAILLAMITLFLVAACSVVDDGTGTTTRPQLPMYTDVPPAEIVMQDVPVVSTDSGPPAPRYTYVVAIADPHIVNQDDEHDRNLRAIGQTIAGMPFEIQGAFVAGDIVFNLPYDTIEEYRADPVDRFDIAQEIFEGFTVPVYPALGNHDLAIGRLPREMTEQLFREHFGTEPYYTVDLGIWKFIILSNFHGPTQNPDDPAFDVQTGSLGAEQLAWLDEQLADGRPAVLMLHFPMLIVSDLPDFLARYRNTVRLVLSGHSHAWLNLSNHFAVPSMVVGSSQFDGDSFLVLELDNVLRTWRILDWDRFHWGTGFALPWQDPG